MKTYRLMNKNFSVMVSQDKVTILFPDLPSPYVPMHAEITTHAIKLGVWDNDLDMMTEKTIEWRDGIIMHKALTKIYGNKPKWNGKNKKKQ